MINNRGSYRLRKQFDVSWSIPEQKIEGEGIIFNISMTGMLFVTDKLFEPKNDLAISFKVEQTPSFPPKGKLVRFRKVGPGLGQYQCGVKFTGDASLDPAWNTWMEENMSKLADVEDSRILERFLNQGDD